MCSTVCSTATSCAVQLLAVRQRGTAAAVQSPWDAAAPDIGAWCHRASSQQRKQRRMQNPLTCCTPRRPMMMMMMSRRRHIQWMLGLGTVHWSMGCCCMRGTTCYYHCGFRQLPSKLSCKREIQAAAACMARCALCIAPSYCSLCGGLLRPMHCRTSACTVKQMPLRLMWLCVSSSVLEECA